MTPAAASPVSAPLLLGAVSVGVGAVAALPPLLAGDLFAGGILLAAALGAALALMLLHLPASLRALVAVASVANGASIAWDWYAAWPPFDEWAHLLNPVVLVAASMVWLRRGRFVETASRSLTAAAAAVYGLVLALAWEAIETWFWTYPFLDTFTDVALGVVGSAAGGLLALRVEPTPAAGSRPVPAR